MLNEIIAGIAIRLNATFGDSYEIHQNTVKQGLKEPCFFIAVIKPEVTPLIGQRFIKVNPFDIQYFPQNPQDRLQSSLLLFVASYCVDRCDEQHRLQRRNLGEHREMHQPHLPIRRIPLHYWNSTKPAHSTRFSNHEASDTIESRVQRPEIGRPISVQQASLEREKTRENLQEIGNWVVPNNRIKRNEEG